MCPVLNARELPKIGRPHSSVVGSHFFSRMVYFGFSPLLVLTFFPGRCIWPKKARWGAGEDGVVRRGGCDL